MYSSNISSYFHSTLQTTNEIHHASISKTLVFSNALSLKRIYCTPFRIIPINGPRPRFSENLHPSINQLFHRLLNSIHRYQFHSKCKCRINRQVYKTCMSDFPSNILKSPRSHFNIQSPYHFPLHPANHPPTHSRRSKDRVFSNLIVDSSLEALGYRSYI